MMIGLTRIFATLVAIGMFSTLIATTTLRPVALADGPLPPSEISLRLKGTQAKQISEAFHIVMPAGGYLGEVSLRPSGCSEPAPGNALHPSNVALDFKIKHPKPSTGAQDFCIFSVLTGEAGAAKGAIVPAIKVPEVEDNEPVYEAQVGYALVGGTWPAAKGKRSRGGASGTQFALEIDASGVERYYLLNTTGTHKVTIRTVTGTDVFLESSEAYVELPVAPSDQAVWHTIASDTTGQRGEFWKMASAAAMHCNLPGPDPVFTAALAELAKEKVPEPPPVENLPGKVPSQK